MKTDHESSIWDVIDYLRDAATPSALVSVLLPTVTLRVLAAQAYPHHDVRNAAEDAWQRLRASKRALSPLLERAAKNVLERVMPEDQASALLQPGMFDVAGDALISRVVLQVGRIELPDDTDALLSFGALATDAILRYDEGAASKDARPSGVHVSPSWLNSLLADVAIQAVPEAQSVYDPACGTCGTLAHADRAARSANANSAPRLYGQDIDAVALAKGACRLLASGASTFDLRVGDTLRRPQFLTSDGRFVRHFDIVVSTPPLFGERSRLKQLAADLSGDRFGRFRYGDPAASFAWLFVQHALASTDDNGVAVMTTTASHLSSTRETDVRQDLVDADVVDSVVLLPTGWLFESTANLAVLSLTPTKGDARRGHVFFLDAAGLEEAATADRSASLARKIASWLDSRRPHEGISARADANAIAQRGYSLSPTPFVPPPPLRPKLPSVDELDRALEDASHDLLVAYDDFAGRLDTIARLLSDG